MKQFFQYLVILVFLVSLASSTQAQLDTSFGTNGRIIIDVYNRDLPTKVLESPTGKLLIMVRPESVTWENNSKLVQYNSNGTLDTSFGNSGYLQISDPSNLNRSFNLYDFAFQADGKIVISGSSQNLSNFQTNSFVGRLNANGSVDTSFATNGFHYPVMSSLYSDNASYIKVLADGKIAVAGNGGDSYGGLYFIQYLQNGSLDASFNGQGFVYGFNALTVKKYFRLANGKYLLVGVNNSSSSNIPHKISRLNTDGTNDTSFSEIQIPNWLGFFDAEIGTDEKLYILTTEYNDSIYNGNTNEYMQNPRYELVIKRYLSNGSIDNSFGNNGISKASIAGYFTNNDLRELE